MRMKNVRKFAATVILASFAFNALWSASAGASVTETDIVKIDDSDTMLDAEKLQIGTGANLTADTLTVGGVTYITGTGLNAADRQILRVAAGTARTDAVNLGQLHDATRIIGTHNYYGQAADSVTNVADAVNAADKALGKVKSGTNYLKVYNPSDAEHTSIAANLTELDAKLGKAATDYNGVNNSNTIGGNIDALNKIISDYANTVTGTSYADKGTVAGDIKALDSQVLKNTQKTEELSGRISEFNSTIDQGVTVKGSAGGSRNIKMGETLTIGSSDDSVISTVTTDGKVNLTVDGSKIKAKAIYDSVTDSSGITKEVKFGADGISAGGQTITNAAAGAVTNISTDAVNGSQLYNYSKVKVVGGDGRPIAENLTTADGIEIAAGENIELAASGNRVTIRSLGGTDTTALHYDTDGKGGRQNGVTLKDADGGTAAPVAVHNVAEGSASTDAVNVGQLDKAIDYVIEKGVGKLGVAYTDETKSLIELGNGEPGSAARITNVAAGEVSPTSTDAVNGSQLYQANLAIKSNTQEIRDIGAISAALAGLHFVEPDGDEDEKFAGAAAYGGYRGSHAGAIGVAYKPNPNFMFSASTSVGHDQNAYNAGVSLKFGKGETAVTRTSLQKQVKHVKEENAVLKNEIETLKNDKVSSDKENAALKAENDAQNKLIKTLLERVDKLENLGSVKSVSAAYKQQVRAKQPNAVQAKREIEVTEVQKPIAGKSIQVLASTSKEGAQQLAGKLYAKGYNAFVGEGVVNGRTYYKVFADGGNNPKAKLAELQKAGIDGFILK